MSDVREELKVWWGQSEFLWRTKRLIKRVARAMGLAAPPSIGLIAVPWNAEEQVVVEGLEWDLDPAAFAKDVRAAQQELVGSGLLQWVKGMSSDALGLKDVVDRALEPFDGANNTRSFATGAAQISGYVALLVLRFPGADYPGTAVNLWAGCGYADIGLLPSIVHVLLRVLFDNLCKEAGGGRRELRASDIDDVFRAAGEHLLERVWKVVQALPQRGIEDEIVEPPNLFAQVNAIASLAYEGAPLRGGLVFGRKDAELDLCFVTGVPLTKSMWARKILEMSDARVPGAIPSKDWQEEACFWVASDGDQLLGLVRRGPTRDEFRILFKGQGKYELAYGTSTLMAVRLGLPSLPSTPLEEKAFGAACRRVLSGATPQGIATTWSLVRAALDQKKGALVVIAEDASTAIDSLASQATAIKPLVLDPSLAFRTTAIDGALLLDTKGICVGVGVILDGNATEKGDRSRGARFNSAIRYVNAKEGRLAVVVSEDGLVDLLPAPPTPEDPDDDEEE